ncbi:MAG: arginase family protein [Chloroflexia bacterium]|nr:arginase family protein [Chloroflexia bacterium]
MPTRVIRVPYRYDEREEGLGAGPSALLGAGLVDRLKSAGVEVAGAVEVTLPDEEREAGRTAVNIGLLGAHTARATGDALDAGETVLVLAGDDTATIGVLAGLQRAHGAGAAIGVVWFDAHGDFNTPETSYSGILAGMPVAILAGLAGPLWRAAAGLAPPMPTDRIVLGGVRELDHKEETLLRSTDATILTTQEVCAEEPLRRVVGRLAASVEWLWIHIDLDVLDPRHVPSASTPSPRGLEIDELVRGLRVVLTTGRVAVVSVAGLNPGGGERGKRSIDTTLALLERALPDWTIT